jgi:hypothetical protein
VKARSWKAAETRFARDVGTERKPCDGSRAQADFEDYLCCYQLKVRRMLPAWLWRWLLGVQATAARTDRVGVLLLKLPRQQDSDALVVMSWRDWRDLHGTPRARVGDVQPQREAIGDVLV